MKRDSIVNVKRLKKIKGERIYVGTFPTMGFTKFETIGSHCHPDRVSLRIIVDSWLVSLSLG